jgi:hypothetical protein
MALAVKLEIVQMRHQALLVLALAVQSVEDLDFLDVAAGTNHTQ